MIFEVYSMLLRILDHNEIYHNQILQDQMLFHQIVFLSSSKTKRRFDWMMFIGQFYIRFLNSRLIQIKR